jgi:hypothetical protein
MRSKPKGKIIFAYWQREFFLLYRCAIFSKVKINKRKYAYWQSEAFCNMRYGINLPFWIQV